jgi:hypothetical protein
LGLGLGLGLRVRVGVRVRLSARGCDKCAVYVGYLDNRLQAVHVESEVAAVTQKHLLTVAAATADAAGSFEC